MKKKLLLVIPLLLSVQLLFAQKGEQFIGLEYSRKLGSIGDSYSLSQGSGIGLSYSRQIFETVGLRTGLSLETYSGDYNILACLDPSCPDKMRFTNSYIELPLFLSFNLGDASESKIQESALVGYSLGYKFKKKVKTYFSDDSVGVEDRMLSESEERLVYKVSLGYKSRREIKSNLAFSWGVLLEFGWVNLSRSAYERFGQISPFIALERRVGNKK